MMKKLEVEQLRLTLKLLYCYCCTFGFLPNFNLKGDAYSEEEIKALEADLLNNVYTSKVNKARLPYWKMALQNVCGLINNLNSPIEETGETSDEEQVPRKPFPASMDGFNLEAMLTTYQLQKICHSRALQHWELPQQDLPEPGSTNHEKDEVIKRKIPYILKRQTHISKARRPYILKRSSYY
ncbi:neurotensin/neuromedin N [Microcaecilia unicolor]|uniref:Neurotensin/neuromedin N n=1 Tax=Microcaecilia unicolor TaxID=1415580 RepID=A0A6P7Z4P4_9AMPH|nr:neurotensin/neuromedin N [Microcaecilia unicolor]